MASTQPGPSEIQCLACQAVLAVWDDGVDAWNPTAEALHAMGRVAIPNAGWLCSQECASAFERSAGVRLRRDASGRVNYYGG